MLEIKTKEYFRKFEERDIEGIRLLLSKTIALKDWDNNVEGLDDVLGVYKKIFSSAVSIKVQVQRIYSQDLSVTAELKLIVNECQMLSVVDIIDYTEEYLIKKITAYKG